MIRFIRFFLPENTDSFTPDIFDGTSGGSVVDFNETPLIANIVAFSNGVMEQLSSMFSSLDRIGGDSSGSPMLQYTRYCSFNAENAKVEIPRSQKFAKGLKRFLVIEEIDENLGTNKLERKSSKAEIKKIKKQYYAPPNSTIFTQYTRGYTGVLPISASMKEYFPDFVIPVIEINPGTLPSIQQVQIADLEAYEIRFDSSVIYNNRGSEIASGAVNNVVGLAGKKTELSMFTDELAMKNQGAFIGDIFSTVGNLANVFGFGPIGAIASTAGAIANSLNI